MSAVEPPLRILIVVNLPWDVRLGAIRVWAELAQEWRAAGVVVEHYSLTEAFPKPVTSRVGYALREITFAFKAAAFVRKNSARFDIIDALIGALPFSKRSLRFRGLLVARSVGLYLLYARFEREVQARWPTNKKGTLAGSVVYGTIRRALIRASDRAIRHADLLNVPNETEAECLRAELGPKRPLLVQPYGLNAEQAHALLAAALPPDRRHANRKVSFVGMWSPRKGSRDWAQIIRYVRERVPGTQFCFLGTMVDQDVIRTELGPQVPEGALKLVSSYQPEELPALVADSTLGAFPSYIEGFGLAVIEQLAAGLPTVAYDTAGPRDILEAGLPELLTPVGDVEAFASAICRILLLAPEEYRKLSERSIEAAAPFAWAAIANATLNDYRARLHPAGHKAVTAVP